MKSKGYPKFIQSQLEKIQVYKPGKPIEELERELGVSNSIKLASNENAFGYSPKVKKAITKGLSRIHRYPDADCYYLKNKIAAKNSIAKNSIIVGNGSDELISLAIRAFVGKNDQIVTATPTFLIYRIATQIQGGVPLEIPMHNYRYDLKAMQKAVTKKTKVIFIANPDNPVGSYVTHKELHDFIKKVPKSCLVFIDEAYYEYASHLKDFPKSKQFLKYPNVFISRSFSKAYGLGGLRIGYGMGNSRIIAGLNQIREPFNVNSMAQIAACEALDDQKFVKQIVRATNAEKRTLSKELNKMGFQTIPSATNFVLAEVGPKAKQIHDQLLKKGIIVRYMGAWGLNNFIRVTIGKSAENKRFLTSLKKLIGNTI